MGNFLTPLNNPNTITADGETVDIANWLANFDNIYNYVNNPLVSSWNLMNYAGDLITNNGSNLAVVTTNGVTNGWVLSKNSAAPNGIQWIAPPAYSLPVTTAGDTVYYNGSIMARLPIGTANQVYTVNSGATAPQWSSLGLVPAGTVVLWYGTVATIPAGWALCSGQTVNGYTTPNLQGLFVVGAGNASPPAPNGMGLIAPNTQGGDPSAGAGLGPSHTHTVTIPGPGGGSGSPTLALGGTYPTSTTSGNGGAVTPQYLALCYIMYVG